MSELVYSLNIYKRHGQGAGGRAQGAGCRGAVGPLGSPILAQSPIATRAVYPIVNLLSSTCINEIKIRVLRGKSKLLARI